MNFRVSNIRNNKALTITNMQIIITKIRFWTSHTSKIRRYMMICTCIKKPSKKSSCEGIIKCEIGIGLERMSGQLRTLLDSMPIFITELTLYIVTRPTKTITLLPKTSCCLRRRTKGEPVSMLSKLLTWSITVSAEIMGWVIAIIAMIRIVVSPAPTKMTSSASIEARVMLHKERNWLLCWSS